MRVCVCMCMRANAHTDAVHFFLGSAWNGQNIEMLSIIELHYLRFRMQNWRRQKECAIELDASEFG